MKCLKLKKNSDFKAWKKRRAPDQKADYTEKKFLNDLKTILNELGQYVSREYIGYFSYDGDFGKTYLYAWKAQHEKNVAISTIEIYEKDGFVYLDQIWTSYGDDHLFLLLYHYNG